MLGKGLTIASSHGELTTLGRHDFFAEAQSGADVAILAQFPGGDPSARRSGRVTPLVASGSRTLAEHLSESAAELKYSLARYLYK
jgi:hypothetical protein